MREFTRWAVVLGLVGTMAAAASAQGFTVRQAMDYPFPYGLTAATTGERVAWVFDARGARNVWVADGPSFAARQITHYTGDNGMPIASLRLTADGKTVVYVRGSETNPQGEVADPTSNAEKPEQQVWAADVATGTPRLLGTMNCTPEGCEDIELSPDGKYAAWSGAHGVLWLASIKGPMPVEGGAVAQPLAYIRGNNSQPQWSPDSQSVAFMSARGTHNLIGIYHLGAATVQWVAPSVFFDSMPRWSRDGSELAFIRATGGGRGGRGGAQPWQIWVWNKASGKAAEIWQSSRDANGGFPGEGEAAAFQFAGGNRIVFASNEDGWQHLYSISASGGAPLLLTPGDGEFMDVALTPDGKSVLYSTNHGDVDRRHIWKVSADEANPTAVTPGDGVEWTPVVTGDGRNVVYLGGSATRPAMPHYIAGSERVEIATQALASDYPSAQMVVPQDVTFTSPDGLEIHGQLFVPRGAAASMGKHPGLIFTHGGPPRQMLLGFHPMDAYNYMYAANQYLASRGYVVLSVNYRLSINYGRAFRQPAHAGRQGASEYQDVLAGAKYLQALPYVDADKIGLWGGSYGGYLTAMGLARNSDVFKSGVDYAGVHWWTTLGGPLGAAAGPGQDVAFQASPVASIDKWTSPVLLVQADDDRNVPFAQTVDLVHLLRQHNIPYEAIVIPDEVHDSILWQTWVDFFQATGDFFDRTLVRGEKIQPATPQP